MIADVLEYLHPGKGPFGSEEWRVSSVADVETISYWAESLGAQPTAEQLAAVAATPEYVAWFARKSSPVLVAKDSAKALAETEPLTVGVAVYFAKENNELRAWITSFKAAVAAATTLADLRTRVAALAATPPRTRASTVAGIKDEIEAA